MADETQPDPGDELIPSWSDEDFPEDEQITALENSVDTPDPHEER